MADSGRVLVEDEDGLRVLTLSRPATRNAMDTPMLEGLADALHRASRDASCRALLLTGAGGAFSSGGDVAALGGEDSVSVAAEWTALSSEIAHAVFHAAKPVVAAVDGPAYGAGFALAIACDVVLLSERATLGPVFVQRGIIPDHAALWFLPRIVGLRAAMDLVFSGRPIDAARAASIGLCTRVLPTEGFAAAARTAARELAAGPTRALGAAKLIMNKGLETDMETVQAFERLLQPAMFATDDAREAFAAFRERRPPVFRGR